MGTKKETTMERFDRIVDAEYRARGMRRPGRAMRCEEGLMVLGWALVGTSPLIGVLIVWAMSGAR